MNTICFVCKKEKPLTLEHIIPQSLGGRLKRKIFCKKCNDTFGKSIDSEIAKQFGHIATILRIERERSSAPQPFEVEMVDNELKFLFDGKSFHRKHPIVKIELENDNRTVKHVDITARSKKELEKITQDIQKRYNVPKGIKTFFKNCSGPTDTKYYITIDNTLIRRAVTKVAYGFLCTKIPKDVVLSDVFENVRSYLLGKGNEDRACANFVHTQFMTDYIRPLHKVHIAFNRNDRVVIGYISFFGLYRFTVLLSDKFSSAIDWSDIDYTFDPVRNQEVFGNPNFRAKNLTKEDALHPKQSKAFVQNEIDGGQKIIETYVENYQYLGGTLS